jgi:hypothetical protein
VECCAKATTSDDNWSHFTACFLKQRLMPESFPKAIFVYFPSAHHFACHFTVWAVTFCLNSFHVTVILSSLVQENQDSFSEFTTILVALDFVFVYINTHDTLKESVSLLPKSQTDLEKLLLNIFGKGKRHNRSKAEWLRVIGFSKSDPSLMVGTHTHTHTHTYTHTHGYMWQEPTEMWEWARWPFYSTDFSLSIAIVLQWRRVSAFHTHLDVTYLILDLIVFVEELRKRTKIHKVACGFYSFYYNQIMHNYAIKIIYISHQSFM